MTITVRIPYTALADTESMLMKAGVPSLMARNGLIKHWYDPVTHEWVYEWTPNESTVKS